MLPPRLQPLPGHRKEGMVLLDKVYRQQNDTVFLNILNDLRTGVVTPTAQRVLGGKVAQSYKQDRELAAAAAAAAAATVNGTTGDEGKAGGAGGAGGAPTTAAAAFAVRPTKLFSTNKDVDEYNAMELQKLVNAGLLGNGDNEMDGEKYRYEAIDEGRDPFLNQLRQGTKAPAVLELVVGAQVRALCYYNCVRVVLCR
jgi:hypothetical protein